MPTRPSFRKLNPSDAPILFLSLSSPTQPLSAVDEVAETVVAQRISMVDGVAQVQVFGSQKYAVRAQVDPSKLASMNIGIDQVAQSIRSGTVKKPTGTLYGPHTNYSIQTNDQLMDARQMRPLIVAVKKGVPVRLDEIATVTDSVENDKVANWTKTGRAIVLAVYRQPGTNTVQVIEDVKTLLPELGAQIPASVKLGILFDRSKSIRDSVQDVEITLGVTIALVILVIFVFLRNGMATIIPSLSLPMSLVGTFACMALLDFSLNNLSLMALTLCVGFVVDDAIVVLENIVRHMEMGEDAFQASLKGTAEVGFTIVSMTTSLVAVFIPILFMSGMLGRLFREFAVTITCAILISAVVSLTLIPMLCSRFLRPVPTRHTWLYNLFEGMFDALRDSYAFVLRLVLRLKPIVLVLSFGLVFVTWWLFRHVTTGFIPSVDIGQIHLNAQGPQDTSFEAMEEHMRKISDIVARDPNVQDFMCAAGGSGPSPTGNAGRMFITLKPRDQRKLSADDVIQELRRKFAHVPGIKVYMQNPPAIRIGGMSSKGMYQFTLQGLDLHELYAATDLLKDKIREIPGVQDANTDLEQGSLQANLVVDRDKASSLGLTSRAIDQALGLAYGSSQIATIYTDTNEYKVILEVAPEFSSNPNMLRQLYVRASGGNLVPLSTIAHFTRGSGPLQVNHLGQLPSATISYNLKPGASLGSIVAQIQNVARNVLPAGVTASLQGNAQAFQSSFSSLIWLLLIAIVVIYIVLGILYESFAHPITILSGLPSAGIGALLTLIVFGVDLDIYGFLGLIMLIGIVKKNAIMMIDHALEIERRHAKSPEESVYEAALIRFRPIMMTTMAAIMGSLPIAVGLGSGAEARQPLGLAVVGGLLVSQLLTLFITPVVYVYVEKASRFFGRRPNLAPRIQVWAETGSGS
jgi:HAE1 family hydrophobic/amphiphilic exporter-1